MIVEDCVNLAYNTWISHLWSISDLFLFFSNVSWSTLSVEKAYTAVISLQTVLIVWSTQSPVILKAFCGSSSLSIFTTFGFILARRVRSSHTLLSQYCVCVCVAGCSSWTVTVRAAPSRCVSCWPNRTSWCRRETHSARRCRTYALRYKHAKAEEWVSVCVTHSSVTKWICSLFSPGAWYSFQFTKIKSVRRRRSLHD